MERTESKVIHSHWSEVNALVYALTKSSCPAKTVKKWFPKCKVQQLQSNHKHCYKYQKKKDQNVAELLLSPSPSSCFQSQNDIVCANNEKDVSVLYQDNLDENLSENKKHYHHQRQQQYNKYDDIDEIINSSSEKSSDFFQMNMKMASLKKSKSRVRRKAFLALNEAQLCNTKYKSNADYSFYSTATMVENKETLGRNSISDKEKRIKEQSKLYYIICSESIQESLKFILHFLKHHYEERLDVKVENASKQKEVNAHQYFEYMQLGKGMNFILQRGEEENYHREITQKRRLLEKRKIHHQHPQII